MLSAVGLVRDDYLRWDDHVFAFLFAHSELEVEVEAPAVNGGSAVRFRVLMTNRQAMPTTNRKIRHHNLILCEVLYLGRNIQDDRITMAKSSKSALAARVYFALRV